MLERVAEILFDNEKETVVKEFYREVGNSDPVDVSLAVCDDTTDALIESYKKAYSWQINDRFCQYSVCPELTRK